MNSVKYQKRGVWHEFSSSPWSFEDIMKVYGKEQVMLIDQLHIFQPAKKEKLEFEYNEDFFTGFDLSLDMFATFLGTIDKYTIYSMVFEIETGVRFKIEEDCMTVAIKKDNQPLLLKTLSLFLSEDEKSDYQRMIKNQGRFVYFKNTESKRIVSKIELWKKFEACVN